MTRTTDETLQLVGLLAGETRFLVQEHFPGVPTCIMSTAICRDVLAYFDVPSEPLSVWLIAGNAEWVTWMREHDWAPQTELPEGAWSVGTDPSRPAAENRWNGHLVLGVADGLLDADLGYWGRPERGIPLPQGAFFVNGPGVYTGKDGSLVIYRERVADDRVWARAKDWTDPRRRKRIVGSLIRQGKALFT